MLRKSKQIKLGCIKAFFRVGIYCHIKKLPQITTCILCADLVDTRTSKCIQSFFFCFFFLLTLIWNIKAKTVWIDSSITLSSSL